MSDFLTSVLGGCGCNPYSSVKGGSGPDTTLETAAPAASPAPPATVAPAMTTNQIVKILFSVSVVICIFVIVLCIILNSIDKGNEMTTFIVGDSFTMVFVAILVVYYVYYINST